MVWARETFPSLWHSQWQSQLPDTGLAMYKWCKKHVAIPIWKRWLSRIRGIMEPHDFEPHKQGMQDIQPVESKVK